MTEQMTQTHTFTHTWNKLDIENRGGVIDKSDFVVFIGKI